MEQELRDSSCLGILMRFILSLWMLVATGFCWAQAPFAGMPRDDAPAVQLFDSDVSDSYVPESGLIDSDVFDPYEYDCDETELQRFKKQALQSVVVSAGLMADASGNEFNSSFLDASIGSGIPLGSFDNIVGVTPKFRVDWIDAAPTIDIPSALYQFELQFFYRRPIRERLSAMAIFSPSVRSDLTTSDSAFRIFALGLLNWECVPDRLTLSGGAVYLGRADLPVLPAIGLTWTPNRRVKLDLRFPSSSYSYRFAKDGGRSEKWAYFSAGLGGNTWAVTRDSSLTDELSLRDFRLLLGIQKLLNGGGGWFVERGYAFSRSLEYESEQSQLKLGDGFVLQGGWRY